MGLKIHVSLLLAALILLMWFIPSLYCGIGVGS